MTGKELETKSISWLDTAEDSIYPCIRCGARVAQMKTFGGVLESEKTILQCRRCRNNQKVK